MGKQNSSLFLTNEFAKLCNTTKDTLFHYDEIGLLKPKEVRSNGYRYYSIDQMYTFYVIHELKRVGCSLDEIKDYLILDESHFNDFIEYRTRIIEDEIFRMQRSIQFLSRMKDMTEEAAQAKSNTPVIVKRVARYLLVSPRNSQEKMMQKQNAESLQQHFAMCENDFGAEAFPFGFIVLPETLASGEIFDAFIFSWFAGIPNEEECEKANFDFTLPDTAIQPESRIQVMPAGNYLSMYHFGGRETIGYTYQKMFNYIDEHNLHIDGNAYEVNLVNFLNARAGKDFVTRIFIRVRQR